MVREARRVGVADPLPRAERMPGFPSQLGSSTGCPRTACVVAVGKFDGVHLGHQAVIRRARRLADDRGQSVVAVVFAPHPSALLPDRRGSVLTPLRMRAELLHAAGADAVLVVPLDRDVVTWSPGWFAEFMAVDGLRASAVVVGGDFSFGERAVGGMTRLHDLGAQHGFGVEVVALEGDPEVWSSTLVRTRLARGDIPGVTEALGRWFAVRGEIVEGDRRGRLLGYPTANLSIPRDVAIPPDGVYAGTLTDSRTGEVWPAAISVGSNPTFRGERARRIESHALDRDDLDLYGAEVEVRFAKHLRGMVAFDSVNALVRQMRLDVAEVGEVVTTSAEPPAVGDRSGACGQIGA